MQNPHTFATYNGRAQFQSMSRAVSFAALDDTHLCIDFYNNPSLREKSCAIDAVNTVASWPSTQELGARLSVVREGVLSPLRSVGG